MLGPIPVGWAIACAAADSNCLILGLIILMKTGSRIARPATDYTVVSEEFGRQAGLSRNQRHRAVNALEAAGLAVVERWPNRAPRVRLKAWDRETDG